MKVQRILEFIKELHKEEKMWAKYDAKLLAKVSKQFEEKDPKGFLKNDDIIFLKQCYARRWHQIQLEEPEHDYTLSNSAIELKWVNFAKDLEAVAKSSYLKILMPTITNDADPYDNSALTETVTMSNFYLAANGTILCRKRSLCDYLLAHEFVLSTSKDSKQAVVFTLDELSRLKRCKVSLPFSIENEVETEHFTDFWDFMRKKVFTCLSKYDELPLELLPRLLELIEHYYVSKSDDREFREFKSEVNDFFQYLYSHNIAQVNSLYGQKVFYKGQECYLLDVFIAIFEATAFNLESEMKAIATLLFRIHPILKANSNELKTCFIKQSRNSEKPGQAEAYLHCCCLLISLFVTEFHFRSFLYQGIELCVWDKSNRIPSEFREIYQLLIQAFYAAEPNYVDILHQIRTSIIPKINTTSWIQAIIGNGSSGKDWLDKVNNLFLADVGGYWFPSELIISTLLTCTMSKETKKLVTVFLDELVATYTQAHGSFIKEVRVNILFSQLLAQISKSECRNLIMLMTLCNKKSAEEIKSAFLSNCALHINNRLIELGYKQYQKSYTFYLVKENCQISQDFISGEEQVLTIVENYTTKLPLNHLESEVQEEISLYLLGLKKTILTIEERNQSKKDTEITVDPLGLRS